MKITNKGITSLFAKVLSVICSSRDETHCLFARVKAEGIGQGRGEVMQSFRRGLEMGPLRHEPDGLGAVLEFWIPREYCKWDSSNSQS